MTKTLMMIDDVDRRSQLVEKPSYFFILFLIASLLLFLEWEKVLPNPEVGVLLDSFISIVFSYIIIRKAIKAIKQLLMLL